MDGLQEYIINIIYVAVFALVIEIAVPKHSFKKYISGTMSFLIIISLLSPIFNFLENDKVSYALQNAIEAISFSNYTYENDGLDINNYKESIILSSVKDKLEQELYLKLNQRLAGIISVKIEIDESYKLEKIVVYISRNNLSEDRIKYILDVLLEEYELPRECLVIKKEKDTYE